MTVLYAAGHIVGQDDTAAFAGYLPGGDGAH